MHTPATSLCRGFTLNQLVASCAVVVALALLAGLALPRYFDATAAAQASTARATLGEVRADIANFYANAAIAGEPRYPSLAELLRHGDVVQHAIPENPFKRSDNPAGVREATWNPDAPPVATDAPEGWNYDPALGRFWANSTVLSAQDSGPENTW